MSGERLAVDIWIVMNEAGEYVVASDETSASD